MASAHELRTATLGRMTESIPKELNECLCARLWCYRVIASDSVGRLSNKMKREATMIQVRQAKECSVYHSAWLRLEGGLPKNGGDI